MGDLDDIDITVAEVSTYLKDNNRLLCVDIGERNICSVEVDEARIVVAVLSKLLGELDASHGGFIHVEVYDDPRGK